MHDLAQAHDLAVCAASLSTTARCGASARNAFPFIVVGALWEAVAHLGLFPAQFFPPLETIAAVFVRLTLNGVLPHHAFDTLLRLDGRLCARGRWPAWRSAS